jgi:hypothetical protein
MDYFKYKVEDNWLYYTSECIIEAFHVHADKNRSRSSCAKFWVTENGEVSVAKPGKLSKRVLHKICKFISIYYKEMYVKWVKGGGKPEFKKKI